MATTECTLENQTDIASKRAALMKERLKSPKDKISTKCERPEEICGITCVLHYPGAKKKEE